MTEDELEQALLHLYELGLVSIEYQDDLTPMFKITDDGIAVMNSMRGELDV